MTQVLITDTKLDNLADAIAGKLNSVAAPLTLDQMTSAVSNITTKVAATITPSTTNQTIVAGTYLTGTQTISGDSNLVATNIKHGVNLFNVTGTFGLRIGTATASPSSRTQTITFTGLAAEPLAFGIAQAGQYTFSKSYR